MKTLFTTLFVALFTISVAAQKNYVEVRGASPYYQYEEYSRELTHNWNLDTVHIGVEGQHQFFFGLGKHFAPAKGVMLTPYLYLVVGSNGQRGPMVALNVSSERGKWKINAFVGQYLRVKGAVKSYLALDTGDITRTATKRFDIGVSSGFFHQEGVWNLQAGPLVRIKDKIGTTSVSYRFGKINELRVTRTFSF